ncbi:MAG TPA: xanthine dehydrogenase family protein subunit M [candidate division Zixibacteria bacterium]|nr:xanthine dehydrogenase family protein subunit M [candidate division Zixibacteria bacterium]
MIGVLPPFEYYRPSSLEEALAVLARFDGEVLPYAGGTDLLVALKQKKALPRALMDVKWIPELNALRLQDAGLSVGAAVTARALARSVLLREGWPVLAQASGTLGSMQIGNRATLGGNLCNASPAADGAPPLLALDARVKLVGRDGGRELPLEKFFVGPKRTVADRELLTEIVIPEMPPRSRGVFLKLGPRGAPEDIAIVSVAVVAVPDAAQERWQEVRIALGAVAPTPVRARRAEQALAGRPIDRSAIESASRVAAAEDARPIDDLRGSASYRRAMVGVLVGRALADLAGQIRPEGAT